MTPGIEQMLIAAGATAGGILLAALFSFAALRWSRARTWENASILGIILFIAGGNAWFAAQGKAPAAAMLIAGSFFGALLTIRAIFGLVRFSRSEVDGSPAYRGATRDIILVCTAFVPILVMFWLVKDF